jgi:hypothetical protein
MLSVILMCVTYQPFLLGVIILNVIMLTVVMLSVVMLSVVVPYVIQSVKSYFPIEDDSLP